MTKNQIVAGFAALGLMGVAYFAGTKRPEAVGTARAETHSTATTTPAPSSTPSTTTTTTPSPKPERGPLDMSGLDGLGAKLAAEKAMAGKAEPSAATVFAAVQDKLGIPLGEKLQPVASPIGGQYCERMSTKHDVYVVVCEFANEESAKAGQKKATNDIVKRREVLQKRSSTCAVHQAGESKEAETEAKRIKDLFRSL